MIQVGEKNEKPKIVHATPQGPIRSPQPNKTETIVFKDKEIKDTMIQVGEKNEKPKIAIIEFNIGDIVEVQPRMSPGMNKLGGVARIKKKTFISEGEFWVYDVVYIVNRGDEKNLRSEFILPSNLINDEPTTPSRSGSKRRKRRSSSSSTHVSYDENAENIIHRHFNSNHEDFIPLPSRKSPKRLSMDLNNTPKNIRKRVKSQTSQAYKRVKDEMHKKGVDTAAPSTTPPKALQLTSTTSPLFQQLKKTKAASSPVPNSKPMTVHNSVDKKFQIGDMVDVSSQAMGNEKMSGLARIIEIKEEANTDQSGQYKVKFFSSTVVPQILVVDGKYLTKVRHFKRPRHHQPPQQQKPCASVQASTSNDMDVHRVQQIR